MRTLICWEVRKILIHRSGTSSLTTLNALKIRILLKKRATNRHESSTLHKGEDWLQVTGGATCFNPPARIFLKEMKFRPLERMLFLLLNWRLMNNGSNMRWKVATCRNAWIGQVWYITNELIRWGGWALITDTREIISDGDVSVTAIPRLTVLWAQLISVLYEKLLLMLL
jgi:hypothetical protein